MENLTKTQLVLLAILLSFVVSIVTAITVVTLLEQAPDGVSQPITRVIRQTIEKVVPGESKTVIIKEEDLLIDAIEKNKESVVSLFKKGETPEDLGLGFVFSKDGLLVTQNKDFLSEGEYFVKSGENEISAKILLNDQRGFSVFKLLPERDQKLSFSTLGDPSKLKAGQTLVFLSETVSRDTFAGMALEELPPTEEGGEGIKFAIIKTSRSQFETPATVLDLDGDVVGFAVSLGEKNLILPANLVTESLNNNQ